MVTMEIHHGLLDLRIQLEALLLVKVVQEKDLHWFFPTKVLQPQQKHEQKGPQDPLLQWPQCNVNVCISASGALHRHRTVSSKGQHDFLVLKELAVPPLLLSPSWLQAQMIPFSFDLLNLWLEWIFWLFFEQCLKQLSSLHFQSCISNDKITTSISSPNSYNSCMRRCDIKHGMNSFLKLFCPIFKETVTDNESYYLCIWAFIAFGLSSSQHALLVLSAAVLNKL